MEDFSEFITNSPQKSRPMTVEVISESGEVIDTYDAPEGFQLDRYVASLFPSADLMVSGSPKDLTISVIVPDTSDIYQIHHGIYR